VFQGIMQEPQAESGLVRARGDERGALRQRLPYQSISPFVASIFQEENSAIVKPIMALVQVGPLAMIPGAASGLPRNDRKQDLSPKQAVQSFSGREFEPAQPNIKLVRIQLAAELPLARPRPRVLVDVSVYQVQIEICRRLTDGL